METTAENSKMAANGNSKIDNINTTSVNASNDTNFTRQPSMNQQLYQRGFSNYSAQNYNDYPQFGRSTSCGMDNNYSSSYNNQYSSFSNNQMNPVNDPRQNQMPPSNFRTDFWGVLNGFNCVVNILYAGSGLVNYGRIFVHMSLKVIKAVCGKSLNFMLKITGLNFLKKVLFSATKIPWIEEFSTSNVLNGIWQGEVQEAAKKSLLGKFMTALRICSLLGALLVFYLKKKSYQFIRTCTRRRNS